MYEPLLTIHSYLRWVLLGLFVAVLVVAVGGWRRGGAWGSRESRLSLALVITLDLQLLLGLLLYMGISPITAAAFRDAGAAMKDGVLRFWMVEHVFLVTVAATCAHLAKIFVGKASSDHLRFKRASQGFGVALLIVLAAIPWPGLSYGRPLLRGILG